MKSFALSKLGRIENPAWNVRYCRGTYLDQTIQVLTILFVLIVLTGVGFRLTTAEERARAFRRMLVVVRQLMDAAIGFRQQSKPFRETLRSQTPWALVTPALIALNVAVFLLMLRAPGPAGSPDTLIGWGGSIGPRTTNGEWWRLVTSLFVHTGVLHLLATLAGLVQIGFILERLLGPVAFTTVYLTAGTLASLISLRAHPAAVSVGGSGGVLGLLGLLIAIEILGQTPAHQGDHPVHDAEDARPSHRGVRLWNTRDGGP